MGYNANPPHVKRARAATAIPSEMESGPPTSSAPYPMPHATTPLITMAAHILALNWAQALRQGQSPGAGSASGNVIPPPFPSLGLPPPPPPAEEVAALAHRYAMQQHPPQLPQQQPQDQPAGPLTMAGEKPSIPLLPASKHPPPMCLPLSHPPVDARRSGAAPAPVVGFPAGQQLDQHAQQCGASMAPFKPPAEDTPDLLVETNTGGEGCAKSK